MEIKNEQVKEIYKRWEAVFDNQENKLESRLKAYSILKVIEALVDVYENKLILDDEYIDDLFIAWNKNCRPAFKEELLELRKDFEKQFKNMIQE